MEMYLVSWETFKECDTYTTPLELFTTRELADGFVAHLRVLGLYAQQLISIEFSLTCGKMRRNPEKEAIIAMATKAGIPEEAFPYSDFLRRVTGLAEPKYPVPRTYDDTYTVEPFQLRDNLDLVTWRK